MVRYKKALEYLNKSGRKGFQKEKLLNNLSLVYQKQKEYQKAIATLDEALLNKELRQKNLNLYTKIIDNRAYSKFLMGEESGVLEDFQVALHLRDSMSNEAGIGISNMHLSEFYLKKGDSLRAFDHADKSHGLAKQFGLNRDILSSLVLMSKADPMHASNYMNEYISLNDSLLLEERKIRDKFARIEFDTETYIAANKDLKKKNIWISLSSVLGLATLSLFFFAYRQKARNKTLMLQQQQQEANAEIYDLMLKQQSREEEGRLQERVRISEELHDGALARLFSVRIGLGFLNVLGSEKETKQYEEFMKELQRVEKEIRSLSHALKNEDLSTKMDFPKLLSELMEEQSGIGMFSYELIQDSSIAWNQVDEKIKINLFRIVQESICNIIKYADSSKVKVTLNKKQHFMVLQIVDNGRGFNTNKKYKGIGLKNMRSRAKSIDADLDIMSAPKKGTTISFRIPTNILYHEETT